MAINRTKVLEAAQKHRRKGNLERAIKEYRKLMEDDPQDMRTLLVLADLYVKTQKPQDALNAYKSIAYHYLKDDIYDKAVGVFKQALNLDPKDPALRRDLGEAYHRMGRLKEAVGEYHHAQRLYEGLKDAHSQRDILERMVRLEPDEPALRIKLAEHYVRLKMTDEAVNLFEYAARQFDEDGRLDDYLKVMERIIYMRPQNTETRKIVAQHYLEGREPQRALKHLRKCFEISNTDMKTLELMSSSFEQLGDTEKAVLVYSQLAKLHRDQGNEQRSHQIYEHILRLDPQNKDAQKMLAFDAKQKQQSVKAPPTPKPAPQQQPQPNVYELPDVEFLDDDLADELGLDMPAQPKPPAPKPTPPTPKVSPPKPQVTAPKPRVNAPKPAPSMGADLLSFAESALDEIGDIGLEKLPTSPDSLSQSGPLPVMDVEVEPVVDLVEVEPVELVPEVQPSDEELEIAQSIDESKVFMKYGLKDRASHTLSDLVHRFPHSILARTELAGLYENFGERVLAADQYVEMAKLVRATPARCTQYLEKAAMLFGSTAQVEAIARAENLPYGLSQPSTAEDELIELDLLGDLDVDDALSALGPPMQQQAQVLQEDDIMELDDLDIEIEEDLELDTGPIDAQAIALEDLGDLSLDTDDVVMEGMEDDLLSMDQFNLPEDTEHDHKVPVSLGGIAQRLQNMPEATPSMSLSDSHDGGFSFSAEDADAMFDNLFGDAGEVSSVSMSFAGAQDLGGLAEVDFLMEQGLVNEAEDALKKVEAENPHSASLHKRRVDLESMRSGGTFQGANPFSASRSLSKQFAYNSVDEMAEAQHQDALNSSSVPSLISAGESAVNTNFELGVVYMEMGLFDDALEEFQQSLHDPDVRQSSSYNMALCEFNLGRKDQSRQRLQELLRQPSLSPNVKEPASALLRQMN